MENVIFIFKIMFSYKNIKQNIIIFQVELYVKFFHEVKNVYRKAYLSEIDGTLT